MCTNTTQTVEVPLGRFRDGELLSFDTSGITPINCSDSELVNTQRQIVVEVVGGELVVNMIFTRPHASCSVDSVITTPAAMYSLPTRLRLVRVST